MFRIPQARQRLVPRLAALAALFWIALSTPPGAAQEAVPSARQSEPAGEPEEQEREEEESYDDELLEPSDTGYIDDAIVRSRLRLRYDSATGATKPDRAEFIYGKCLCFARFFGQDAASPGPAENLDFAELELTWERAFSRRLSLFVEIPFRSVDLTILGNFVGPLGLPGPNISNSGLGDIRAGVKYALIAEPHRYVTFQLRGYLASGEADQALGTGHASIEPGLLYFGRLGRRLALSSELRWWHPLEGSSDPVSPVGTVVRTEPPFGTDPPVRNDDYAGDVLRFGFGASWEGRGSRFRVSPVAELVGWYVAGGWVFSAESLAEADGDTIVNLKLGARLGGLRHGSIYLGYGFPLSNDEWYDGILRFEYRLALAGPKRQRTAMVARGAPPVPPVQAPPPAPPRDEPPAEPAPGPPTGPVPAAEPETPAGVEAPVVPPEEEVAPREEETAVPEAAEAAPLMTPEEAVRAAVRRWSEAWAGQRVEDYLAAYSAEFRPARGMSRSAWQAQRRRRLSAPSFIRVVLEEIGVEVHGPAQATAEFTQHYESNTYRDTVRKRLVMRLEGAAWKILEEEAWP